MYGEEFVSREMGMKGVRLDKGDGKATDPGGGAIQINVVQHSGSCSTAAFYDDYRMLRMESINN